MRGPILLVCAVVLTAGFTCEKQSPRAFGTPRIWTTLKSNDVDESSGIAPSALVRGAFWTHNDDGETLEVFRFGESGAVTKWIVPGVVNRDCEDMASATLGGKSYLYVADIGDNAKRWPSARVYRFEEPTSPDDRITKVDVFELAYPDGAHNAEAFMVDPKSGDFWIVEKTAEGKSGVYKAIAPKPGGVVKLARMGELEVGGSISGSRLITGGAISTDGKFIALRTYLAAYEFPMRESWWTLKPANIRTNIEGQGEAITYSLDGTNLFTTSEGKPCPVSIIPIQ